MKWFFAMTQAMLERDEALADSQKIGFAECARAAVCSAKENTSLQPHLIFDGEECAFTREMAAAGVKVLLHRLSFYDRLAQAQQTHRPEWGDYMRKAAGAFMKLELPFLETEDQFVLFTDYDVLFRKEPELRTCRPQVFAACGQFELHKGINTGVMVLNLNRIREDAPSLIDFMCHHFGMISGYDQELFRVFYYKNGSPLPPTCNWKPYWGINKTASIVHFYGAKPLLAEKLLKNPSYWEEETSFDFYRQLFFRKPEGYAFFIQEWEEYASRPSLAHEKVKEEPDSDEIQIQAFDAARQ
ncbi:hypothetical protein FAI40_03335 [Acetobacteraceae bacterium]|nr:hypothetical protein FAI40_03335 [Acetobacteraceae bacterium]